MVLNEPEANLHPSLLLPLARLLTATARSCQIIVVSHSSALLDALRASGDVGDIALEKELGETHTQDRFGPQWAWPKR